MAKKKSFFGTLLKLGGLAAATAAVYYKRNEIKELLAGVAERVFPEETEAENVEDFIPEEPDIIIDATVKTESEDAAEEDTAEEV